MKGISIRSKKADQSTSTIKQAAGSDGLQENLLIVGLLKLRPKLNPLISKHPEIHHLQSKD